MGVKTQLEYIISVSSLLTPATKQSIQIDQTFMKISPNSLTF